LPLALARSNPESSKYFATIFDYPVFISYLCTLNMKQNNNHRTEEEYYIESKRLRAEVMQIAESLKGNPMRFVITNEITMRVEITKTDLKTIVSKNVGDDKFNAIKNALAKDIRGYLEKAEYLGWRPVAEGKHVESAYFAYFSREFGCRTILCMRRMADGDIFKPYAIINDYTFSVEEKNLRK